MKTCSCGKVVDDDVKCCPECGKSLDIDNAQEVEDKQPKQQEKPAATPLGAMPIGTTIDMLQKKKPDEQPKAKPISAVFDSNAAKPAAATASAPKKEFPKAAEGVEVKPIANASQGRKLNPMKNPPPIESPYSLLTLGSLLVHMIIMMIPIVGFVYALLLVMMAKKHNLRTVAVAVVMVYLILAVVIAVGALVTALLFEQEFNGFFEKIKYIFDIVKEIF